MVETSMASVPRREYPDNPVFIITGDRTRIYVDGQDGDGINAGYNLLGRGWTDAVILRRRRSVYQNNR